MKTSSRITASGVRIVLMLALSVAFLYLGGFRPALGKQEGPADVASIKVSFKLDSRLTRGLHLGERWATPPPVYDIVQDGNIFTMEIRAESLDAIGKPVQRTLDWIAGSDRVVILKSRSHADQATIQIVGIGESSLEISAQGVSKTFYIQSTYMNSQCSSMRVRISEQPMPSIQAQSCIVSLPVLIK